MTVSKGSGVANTTHKKEGLHMHDPNTGPAIAVGKKSPPEALFTAVHPPVGVLT